MENEHNEANHNHEGCDCGHDHSHDHGEGHDRISLTLDDGSTVECNVLGVFDSEDKQYIALLPDGSEEVYIYNFAQDGEDVQLSLIETDEEFEKVSNMFYSFFEDESEDEE